MTNINIIHLLTGTLAWCVIGILAFRIYRKQPIKPHIWKILFVMFIGLFSFSISWNMYGMKVRFPILPLGVGILYLFLKGKKDRWLSYKPFSWLGFFANFIFLFTTLTTVPIQHVIFPENEPATYISNIENASIITIHPSAKTQSLNKENLQEQLHSLKQDAILSEEWYRDTNERFPYQLIGASPKFRSGVNSIIYVERDGKGLLISTPKEQFYFRSNHSFLKGGK